MKPKRLIPSHIIIKLLKGKDRGNLESSKNKKTYQIKGSPHIRLTKFSIAIIMARRQ